MASPNPWSPSPQQNTFGQPQGQPQGQGGQQQPQYGAGGYTNPEQPNPNRQGYAPQPQNGQPQYGQPGNNQGYGNPNYGGQNYGAQYTSAPGQHANPQQNWQDPNYMNYRRLEDDSTLWMCVAIGGWALGLVLFTSPLAWYQAKKLKERYLQAGLEPSTQANVAYWVGLISSVIMMIGLFVAAAAVALIVGVGVGAAGG